MFERIQYSGTSNLRDEGGKVFVSKDMRVEVKGLCFDVTDLKKNQRWTHICAPDMNPAFKTLTVQTLGVKNAYGLGQVFGRPGSMSLDRLGEVVETRGDYGNAMSSYAGGAVGEALFPVLYGLGSGSNAFLFVLDNVYKQSWDLRNPERWNIGMFGDAVRGFVLVGETPLELRKKFMALTGRPPVPPKKLFGFWMSEYGYDDWTEIDERLNSMRRDHFPIDGFFLDLQWFGNVKAGSDYTSMGKLTFDESKFPEPGVRIADYRRKGIGLIPIEESYVGRALPEYNVMGSKGYLAHYCGEPTKPSYLTGSVTGNTSEWWGRGGMIDWSNPNGAAFWHENKRRPLIELGVLGHWLDLGEPEMFDRTSCYTGSREPGKIHHQDVHNLFSFFWVESIWDGYIRNRTRQRPYSMLRSGNIGMQRYGGGMWSGDIGGNLESLAGHIASQNHLSWSGIDYYSSDIGGFHRNRASGQPLNPLETQENFTQWFANSTWFDVPVRSHVINLDNDRQTAPNRIGHVESNLANLRERYKLTPYYYSLAWRAWQEGYPLIAPASMIFPADKDLRDLGDHKLLGQILVVGIADKAAYYKDVQLPVGTWYDLRDGSYFVSNGSASGLVKGVPLYRKRLFQLPAYARGGAIVPQMPVDQDTQNVGGKPTRRASGDEMNLSVYTVHDNSVHGFTMAEDDGQTMDFVNNHVRKTEFLQQSDGQITKIQIKPAVGTFQGAMDRRKWLVKVYAPQNLKVKKVWYEGVVMLACSADANPDAICFKPGASPGGGVEVSIGMSDIRTKHDLVVEWTENKEISSSVHFVCRDDNADPRHHSMYVVGSHPLLGEWTVKKGVSLVTNSFLKGIWTAKIDDFGPDETMEWKCVKGSGPNIDQDIEWEPGSNHVVKTNVNGGFSGMVQGGFTSKFE